METKDMNQMDDTFRKLLSDSRLKPHENLKYRIMHQIETEALFTQSVRKKETKIKTQINHWFTILGVFYIAIMAIIIAFYAIYGTGFYKVTELYFSILLITSITATFGFINYMDEKWRATKNKHLKQGN